MNVHLLEDQDPERWHVIVEMRSRAMPPFEAKIPKVTNDLEMRLFLGAVERTIRQKMGGKRG